MSEPPPPPRPERRSRDLALDELVAATGRFLETARRLNEADLRAPSALPGWSRGHVLAHVARNADGLGRLVEWATSGVEKPMYASREARATEIEAGAARTPSDQVTDLESSASVLQGRLAGMPTSAEATIVRLGSGTEIEGWELPLVRIREVEVHHVDLDSGYAVSDWSDAFATRTLDQVAPGLLARPDVPYGRLVALDGSEWRIGAADTSLAGPPQALLGWLLGRSGGSDLRTQGRNEISSAPPWA